MVGVPVLRESTGLRFISGDAVITDGIRFANLIANRRKTVLPEGSRTKCGAEVGRAGRTPIRLAFGEHIAGHGRVAFG
jgi:hypothetical protein